MPPTRRRYLSGLRTQVSQEYPEEAMRLRSGRIISTGIIHQHWEVEESAQGTDTESLEVNNEFEEGQGQENVTVSIDEIDDLEVQAQETDTESLDEITDVQEVWVQETNTEASDEVNEVHEIQGQENDAESIEEVISVDDDEEIQILQDSENVTLTENLNNETIDLTNSPARSSYSPPAIIRRPSQSWFPWRLPSITQLWPFSAVGGSNRIPDKSAANTSSVSAVPTSDVSTDAVKCPLCFETLADLGRIDQIVATKCGHVYCRACLKAALRVKPQCPICRKHTRVFDYHPIYLF